MINVVIIGAGNVATHLYQSFSQAKQLDVVQVFNRKKSHLDFVKDPAQRISDYEEIIAADLYIIAVKDEAIPEVSEKLAENNGLVIHTSGSVAMEELSKFKNYGIFYPLQTFSKNKEVKFRNIPICIEANSVENVEVLREIGLMISDKVFEVNSKQRKALHLSAVFVNNFTNHLFTIAADYCEENELPFDILRPLIKETFAKIDSLPPYSAQTGPALRQDQETIEAHLEMLDKDQKKVYQTLTESIQIKHGKKL